MNVLRNLELEAAILETPLDLAARSVYGDWLAANGDPRGEWFALSAAVEAAPLDVRLRSAATEVFNTHRRAFLGSGARLLRGMCFGFLGGFVDEVRIQPFDGLTRVGKAVAALFSHPTLRFVRQVGIGNVAELQKVVDELALAAPPLLEGVTLVDADYCQSVDIDGIAKLPTLRRLGARQVTWTVRMPNLTELYVHHDANTARLPETVPNLEELTLDCRGRTVSPSVLASVVTRLRHLRRLRLRYLENADEVVTSFTPPPRVELVDISHSPLSGSAAANVGRWPPATAFMALRTSVDDDIVAQLAAAGRSVVASTPLCTHRDDLRTNSATDTWVTHRALTEGRDALRCIPDAGRELYEATVGTRSGEHYNLTLIDMMLTLPSERWALWPWAEAAHARAWKGDYALVEAIAREGLMRDPNETNFHASVVCALYKQKLLPEAVAEIPRTERSLEASKTHKSSAQAPGPSLCLLECMITLVRAGRHADAIALKKRLPHIDDANLQAMLAMCLAAVGEHADARAAFARAANVSSAPYYVLEKYRRNIYEHATAVMALLPPDPKPDEAIAALTRGSFYNQRDWFKHDPNLAAIHDDPRFIALVSQW